MFARFPPPPTSREVTVAERNCTLLSEALDPVDENVSKNTSYQPTGRTGNKVAIHLHFKFSFFCLFIFVCVFVALL